MGTNPLGGFIYAKSMRASPTFNYYGSNTDGGNFNVQSPANGTTTNTAPSAITIGKNSVLWNICMLVVQKSAHWIDCGTQTNGFGWTMDAEL